MVTNKENNLIKRKDYIHHLTNICDKYHNDGGTMDKRPEEKNRFEESKHFVGWVKLKEGLFVDMSDKDDSYGLLIKTHAQKMHCDLPDLKHNKSNLKVHK